MSLGVPDYLSTVLTIYLLFYYVYLSHLTSYQENKDTLFASTLKVEENKVSLFS